MLIFLLCIALCLQAIVFAQTPPGFSPPSSEKLRVGYGGRLWFSPGDSLRRPGIAAPVIQYERMLTKLGQMSSLYPP